MIRLQKAIDVVVSDRGRTCWAGDVINDGWDNINIFLARNMTEAEREADPYFDSVAQGLDFMPPSYGAPFSNRGAPFVPGNAYYHPITSQVFVFTDDHVWAIFSAPVDI